MNFSADVTDEAVGTKMTISCLGTVTDKFLLGRRRGCEGGTGSFTRMVDGMLEMSHASVSEETWGLERVEMSSFHWYRVTSHRPKRRIASLSISVNKRGMSVGMGLGALLNRAISSEIHMAISSASSVIGGYTRSLNSSETVLEPLLVLE